MIAIVDYDAGNLKSVEKALIYIGENPVVTSDADTILNADKVILPGVGAFGDAMEKLHARGLVDVLKKVAAKGTPLLNKIFLASSVVRFEILSSSLLCSS